MKLPVAHTLGNRESDLTKDPLLRNGLAEKDASTEMMTARKRPAIESAFTTTAGQGQGLFTWNIAGETPTEVLVSINDDALNTSPTPLTKKLRFTVQPPADNEIATALSPAVQVSALTQYGAVATGFTSNISVSLGVNPTGATLSGTTTVAAVSGVASFSTLQLNRSGSGFYLAATSTGLRGTTSTEFRIPTKLVFTTEPSNVNPNTNFTVAVTAKDDGGNTDTNFTGTVTLSLWSAVGNAVPTGDFIVDAVSGVATFANISMSDSGVSGNADGTYSFVARADAEALPEYYQPASAISASFEVATFTHTLTAAQSLSSPFIYGVDATAGSISPTTLNGRTITALYGDAETPTNDTVFTINGAAVSQSFFTSLEVVGVGTLLTASATSFNGNTWQWGGTNLITATGTYLVNIT